MPTRKIRLNKSAQTVLDANGNGTVRIGPTNYGDEWNVTNASFQVSTVSGVITKVPLGKVYLGPPYPSNSRGGTDSGSNDSTDLNEILHAAEYITGQWIGGDPGATATMTLSGMRTIQGG